LRVKVTATGERTALVNIMRLVERCKHHDTARKALADRAAFILTIVAIVSGVILLGSSTVQRPAASRMI
jgi:Cu2+-exporting ATPase